MTRSRIFGGLLTAFGVAVLCSLGVWQVLRHGEKQEILAMLRARHDLHIYGPEILDMPAAQADYCRVKLQGEVPPGPYALVGGRYVGGVPGAHLVTLLRVQGADAAPHDLVVNWGWVPSEAIEEQAKALVGPREVDGLVRQVAEFDRDAVPAGEGKWRGVAPTAMAAYLGASPPAWFVTQGPALSAGASPDPRTLPAGGYEVALQSRPHLEYAATWFGLATTLLIGSLMFSRQRQAGKEAGPRPHHSL